MENSAFMEQVKGAIEFGDTRQLRKLLRVAGKRGDDKAIELLKDALRKYGVHIRDMSSQSFQKRQQEMFEEVKSKLSGEAYEQLLERYKEGENMTQLAIRYGIKRIFIQKLLKESNIKMRTRDDSEWEKQFRQLKEYTKKNGKERKSQWTLDEIVSERKQINLRLSDQHQAKLSNLYDFWSSKREFNFLHSKTSDAQIFSTEATFSRFILETALDNLYMDLLNQRQIDGISEWICELRNEHSNLNKLWQKMQSSLISKTGELIVVDSVELAKFEKELESIASKVIDGMSKSKSIDSRLDIPEKMYKKLWPLAVKKSLSMPDKVSSEQDEWTLRMSKLDEKYGNN